MWQLMAVFMFRVFKNLKQEAENASWTTLTNEQIGLLQSSRASLFGRNEMGSCVVCEDVVTYLHSLRNLGAKGAQE